MKRERLTRSDSDSDSDAKEMGISLLKNLDALRGTFFEYWFNGDTHQLPRVLMERFVFSKKLNSGCFGSLFEIYDSKDNKIYAAKVLTVRKGVAFIF